MGPADLFVPLRNKSSSSVFFSVRETDKNVFSHELTKIKNNVKQTQGEWTIMREERKENVTQNNVFLHPYLIILQSFIKPFRVVLQFKAGPLRYKQPTNKLKARVLPQTSIVYLIVTLQLLWLWVFWVRSFLFSFNCKDICQQKSIVGRQIVAYSGLEPLAYRPSGFRT